MADALYSMPFDTLISPVLFWSRCHYDKPHIRSKFQYLISLLFLFEMNSFFIKNLVPLQLKQLLHSFSVLFPPLTSR